MLLSIEGEEATGKSCLALSAPLPIVSFAYDMGHERAIKGGKYEELFAGLTINIIPYEKGVTYLEADAPWKDFDITIFELPSPIQLDSMRLKGNQELWLYSINLMAAAFSDPRVATIVVDTMTIARRTKANAWLEHLQNAAYDSNGNILIVNGKPLKPREQLIQIEYGKVNDSIRDIYCVGPDTPILTLGMEWKAASELHEGDSILGFEEEHTNPHAGRRFLSSVVTHNDIVRSKGYRITLNNGTVLDATPNHMWLIDLEGSAGQNIVWRSTERIYQLRNHHKRLRPITLRQVIPFEQFENSYDSGFLAAALDGEGSLFQITRGQRGLRLSFGQRPNSFQRAVCMKLLERDYHPKLNNHISSDVQYLNLNRASEVMSFLMRTRPLRLLDKWQEEWTNNNLSVYVPPMPNIEIMDIRPIECWVSRLSSSTGTYIAAGFGAHNTTGAGIKQDNGRPKNLIAVHHLTDERVPGPLDEQGRETQVLTGRKILEGLANTHRFVDIALLTTKVDQEIEGTLLKCGYSLAMEGTVMANPTWNSLANLVSIATEERIELDRRNAVGVS